MKKSCFCRFVTKDFIPVKSKSESLSMEHENASSTRMFLFGGNFVLRLVENHYVCGFILVVQEMSWMCVTAAVDCLLGQQSVVFAEFVF